MIASYLAETVTWRRVTGRNMYNEPQYEDTPIKARWESRRALVRSDTGEEVTSEARVFCTALVRTGDALIASDGREWRAITAAPMKGLGGNYEYTEVSL